VNDVITRADLETPFNGRGRVGDTEGIAPGWTVEMIVESSGALRFEDHFRQAMGVDARAVVVPHTRNDGNGQDGRYGPGSIKR
jgi:hypothetical protein